MYSANWHHVQEQLGVDVTHFLLGKKIILLCEIMFYLLPSIKMTFRNTLCSQKFNYEETVALIKPIIEGVLGKKHHMTSDKLLNPPSKLPCIPLWSKRRWNKRRIWPCIKCHLGPYSMHPLSWCKYHDGSFGWDLGIIQYLPCLSRFKKEAIVLALIRRASFLACLINSMMDTGRTFPTVRSELNSPSVVKP